MTTYYTLTLPDSSTPNYIYTTQLDGKEYDLHFIYNMRNTSWYINIIKQDGTDLLRGVRLTPWMDILSTHTREDLPIGRLVLVPSATTGIAAPIITLSNLSTDFQLVYVAVT